jgi:hypothetical protein
MSMSPPSDVPPWVINHPIGLLIRWRAEADRLAELSQGRLDFATRISSLRQCADELERRLVWSHLMNHEDSALLAQGKL